MTTMHLFLPSFQERKKKLALEDAWKKQYNKEERKKRYRDQGKAEKFAEKRQRRD